MTIRLWFYAPFCAIGALALSASADAYVATVKPASGPPTTVVTLTGSGFPASSLVDIFWDTTQISFGSTTASGALTPVTINIPATASPGTHFITVKNDGAAGGAQAAFLIRTNWAAYRWSAAQRNYNPTENTLTPSTIGNIELDWTATVAAGHFLFAPPLVISGALYARDFEGDLTRWTLSTHGRKWRISTGLASYAGITSSGADILTSGSGVVRAYAAATGALVWQAAVGGSASATVSTPTVAADVVYVFSEGGAKPGLYAFSVTCGTAGATCLPLWQGTAGSTGSSPLLEPAPTVANGVVFANPSTGPIAWSTACVPTAGLCTALWSAASDNYANAGGAYAAGYVWLSVGDAVGALPMLCSGSACAPQKSLTTAGAFNSAVSIAGTSLFVTDGNLLQHFSTVCASSPCAALEKYAAPFAGVDPTVAGGLVFVAGQNEIWAYYETCVSCGPIWSASERGEDADNSPVVADGVLYIVDESGVLVYDLSAAAAQIVANRVAPTLSSLRPDRSFADVESIARQRLRMGLPIDDLQPKNTPAANDDD